MVENNVLPKRRFWAQHPHYPVLLWPRSWGLFTAVLQSRPRAPESSQQPVLPEQTSPTPRKSVDAKAIMVLIMALVANLSRRSFQVLCSLAFNQRPLQLFWKAFSSSSEVCVKIKSHGVCPVYYCRLLSSLKCVKPQEKHTKNRIMQVHLASAAHDQAKRALDQVFGMDGTNGIFPKPLSLICLVMRTLVIPRLPLTYHRVDGPLVHHWLVVALWN